MKVVLFCGGLGMRLREYSESIPKPMVNIGYRPILWHVMKYYAHFGHKDFILCLGYRADAVKNYFLNYNECVSNDFVFSGGGKNLELLNSDIQDWRITFADTGISSNIGQRLKAVEKYIEGEEEFLANYSDGLTDLPLPEQLEHFHQHGKIASFLCVRPNLSYHLVSLQRGNGSLVSGIHAINSGTVRINGGFFIFKKKTRMTASGPAWTPSRTSSNWRACVQVASRHGKSGKQMAMATPRRRWVDLRYFDSRIGRINQPN